MLLSVIIPRARGGMSLGSVLVVVALLATLGLALAGGTISHHHLMQRDGHRESARSLARSALALAIEKVIKTPKFGKPGSVGEPLIVQLNGEDPQALGMVAFGSQADGLGLPPSLNNLDNPQSELDALAQAVPANGLRLYGVGRSGGVQQIVEATLVVPPFPWALVSGGTLRAEDGLEIGALRALPQSPSALEELLPADLASNQDVFLGPHTRIQGDVEAAGRVEFSRDQPQTIDVRGEIRPGAASLEIPELELGRFDPRSQDLAYTALEQAEFSSDSPLRGAFRSSDRLDVQGDLRLSGGLLYVNGDLKIQGGIRGKGMVVASGSVEVLHASDLEGSNSVALLSGGSMSLHGASRAHSSIQGLVYARGDFQAESVNVVGALVAHGQAKFRDARMVTVDGAGKFQMGKFDKSVPMDIEDDTSSGTTTRLKPGGEHAPYLLIVSSGPTGISVKVTPNPQASSPPSDTATRPSSEREIDAYQTKYFDVINRQGAKEQFTVPGSAVYDLLEQGRAESGTPEGGLPPFMEFDLSSVFKLEDRIRLIQWKES